MRFITHLPCRDHENEVVVHQVPIAIIDVYIEDIRYNLVDRYDPDWGCTYGRRVNFGDGHGDQELPRSLR